MNRRTFVLATVMGAAAGTAGLAWLYNGPPEETLTINATIASLDRLMASGAVSTGEWNLAQVLTHCAQSVEFSLSGFPQHKSELFKNTAGSLAFAIFSTRGEMRHALSEAIPGAPTLDPQADLAQAYSRFRQSMLEFAGHNGPLAPHFAYGALSKPEYERAHAMHFYNHLLEIRPAS